MSKMIFVNLPITNLKASMVFYEAIGFENNPQFTDETAACMVWSEAINVMLLSHGKWRSFTTREIPPSTSSEVMLALTCDSREAVDAMNEAAANNGGIRAANVARLCIDEQHCVRDLSGAQQSASADRRECEAQSSPTQRVTHHTQIDFKLQTHLRGAGRAEYVTNYG